ncbi:hypothetical protein E0L93_09990 [Rubrobacter taiwanensis]|uniref:Uncharacterized protein n=1 Tax=Rubrobacter taiwanensis TaxID=185139 RepID=A0A4V2NW87_9ACTN|nr:hypothetical protein [Rubrobacter taiwanensis]TCJ16442.1 hypothetical protein E0L93_09990 [Rubrobacter taiwanensis]
MEPQPAPEEAAAILAALEVLRGARQEKVRPRFSAWEFAARTGRPVPPHVGERDSIWAVAARLQQEGW